MRNRVTFSPEDDKLRLYVGRVPRDEYEELREAGFVSTPKQDCDFVAVWTPAREDLALSYLDDDQDIEDEDYDCTGRSADRAERFEGYREKRTGEAVGRAETFESGPAAFGNHSRDRAERQARRHDRHRKHAVSQWSKADYWHSRTAGVIAHALHRASPGVRRGRLLRLEAEQRKHEASREEAKRRYQAWEKVALMEGADQLLPKGFDAGEMNAAQKMAYTLANSGSSIGGIAHPTDAAANEECKRIHGRILGFSAYEFLTKDKYIGKPFQRLTPKQYAELYLSTFAHPDSTDTKSYRWSQHYALRIEYEKAMLAAEGGMAGDADIEVGGWIRGGRTNSCLTDTSAGWKQVHQVFKSPATGRVTSVKVMGTTSGYTPESGYKEYATKPALVRMSVQRLGDGCYRPPTDEERAAFATATKDRKAKEKAAKPKEPTLLNPTDEDAERLAGMFNAAAEAAFNKRHGASAQYYQFEPPSSVLRMTQAEYSAKSKGAYSHCETRTLHACGRLARQSSNMWTSTGDKYDKSLGEVVCKLRVRYPSHIIVLTDKPQKALPLNWDAVAEKEMVEA